MGLCPNRQSARSTYPVNRATTELPEYPDTHVSQILLLQLPSRPDRILTGLESLRSGVLNALVGRCGATARNSRRAAAYPGVSWWLKIRKHML